MSDGDEVLGRVVNDPSLFLFWCPGCECGHHLDTKRWTWNGSMTKPTANPSLSVRISDTEKCHFWVKEGKLHFLNDCTHDLAGQTVDMEPWQ